MNQKESIHNSQKPVVFNYSDYRIFLNDIYKYLKANEPKFSYRVFSARAGFSTPNFLKLVMKAERNLSLDSSYRFAKALHMNKREVEYFVQLVQFNQSKVPEEKLALVHQLQEMSESSRVASLKLEQFEFYSTWYASAIREMLSLADFEEDLSWISDRLRERLGKREIKEALELLQNIGLISRNSEGKLIQANTKISSGDPVFREALFLFHEQMIQMSLRALKNTEREKREYGAITLGLKESDFKDLQARLEKFRRSILDEFGGSVGGNNEVYQLNFQFFPLTKSPTTRS